MPNAYYKTCNEVVIYGALLAIDWRAALAIYALHFAWNVVRQPH